MLNDIKSLLNEETHLSNDFKEKKQTVERLSDLLNDTTEIEDKLFETNKRILDTGQGLMNLLRSHFNIHETLIKAMKALVIMTLLKAKRSMSRRNCSRY